jgi:hypothetical protein
MEKFMEKIKANLEEKLKAHCEQVMHGVVSDAGTAGRVVSQFICMPNEFGVYDDMLDIYYVRQGIQEKLSTAEFSVSLEHLRVCSEGSLEYWLRVDVGDSEVPDRIGTCEFIKTEGEVGVQWEYYELDVLEEVGN